MQASGPSGRRRRRPRARTRASAQGEAPDGTSRSFASRTGNDVEQDTLDKCQELIGYRFRDESLLAQALTHASAAATRQQSNERMEFLGDAVLALCVCQDLYERHGELGEGEMTQIKSAVVSRHVCAVIAEGLGLCELLHLGKGIAGHEDLPQSIAAAVFEAIIGAIHLDGGPEPACEFILRGVRPFIDEGLAGEHQRNYKSILQQHAQRRWSATPEYHVLDEKGPDHSKCFEVAAKIRKRDFPSAWGRTKKEAEQQAAMLALGRLGLLADDGTPEEPRLAD